MVQRIPVAGGGDATVREAQFDVIHEEWSEYRLRDGGTIRVRPTVLRIFRVVNEQGQPVYLPDGSPNVVINTSVQVVATEAR